MTRIYEEKGQEHKEKCHDWSHVLEIVVSISYEGRCSARAARLQLRRLFKEQSLSYAYTTQAVASRGDVL